MFKHVVLYNFEIDIDDDIQENEYNMEDAWDSDIHNPQGQ